MALKRQTQVPVVMAMFLAIMATAVAMAGEGTAAGKGPGPVKPELPPDPAVMKILDALGENQSAWLPPIRTVGNMGDLVRKFSLDKTGPRTRNYCVKWVWTPDRKRAIFCGENAGAPHRLNDVWEYDLPSNTWVLLHEPDADFTRVSAKEKEDIALVKDGILTTKTGAPYDPVHSWWQITYDPEMHALLWVMGNYNKCGFPHKSQVPWGKLEMFAYHPYEKRWEYFRPDATSPPGQNASILEYMPDSRQVLWFTNSWRGCTTSTFDGQSKAWKELLGKKEIQGNANCPGTEAVAAYDTMNRILVAHRGGEQHQGKPVPKCTYHYDPAANKWEKVIQSDEGPIGSDAWTSMTYDSAAGCCYVVDKNLWSYRVGDKKWEKLSPQGPPAPNGMACYNPDRNVLMVDSGGGRVWVWRGQKASAPNQDHK